MTNERLGVTAADIDDIDMARLEAFLRERVPSLLGTMPREDVAIRLGLLARSSPRLVPTIAGLYLFGKIPQLVFPEWGVTCMASNGTTLLDPISRRADLDGALPELVQGAMEFVREGSGSAPDSDAGEYAARLVREIIVNAVVHRDLRKPSRVAVRVFADRLEVWSPGGPPEGSADLDEQSREGGVSQPRNPLIASIARSLGYGEQLGRGLHLVMHAALAQPEHRAEIKATPREVVVVLPSRWRRPRALAEMS
jgi:predicted HTH transcriptional regulator